MPFEAIFDLKKFPNKGVEPNGYIYLPNLYRDAEVVRYDISAGLEYQPNNKIQAYELAAHNFIAEIPRFFLENKGLTTIASKPRKKWKSMYKDATYYMDIVLKMGVEQILCEGPRRPYDDTYFNNSTHGEAKLRGEFAMNLEGSSSYGPREVFKSRYAINHLSASHLRGAVYGHPVKYELSEGRFQRQTVVDTSQVYMLKDPAYAPYTPPYFYGESILRVAFSPSKHTEDPSEVVDFTLQEILDGCEIESTLVEKYQLYPGKNDAGTGSYKNGLTPFSASNDSPAQRTRMKIWDPAGNAGCINPFEKIKLNELQFKTLFDIPGYTPGETNLNVQAGTSTNTNPDDEVWVIYPKWECPVLDFSSSTTAYRDIDGKIRTVKNTYHDPTTGRGLWSGYGTDPYGPEIEKVLGQREIEKNGIKKGIWLSIRESYPEKKLERNDYSADKVESIRFSNESHALAVGTTTMLTPEDIKTGRSGSLIDVCGFESSDYPLGKLARGKKISEAIVAIPYVPFSINSSTNSSNFMTTYGTIASPNDNNKHFFRISKPVVQKINFLMAGGTLGTNQGAAAKKEEILNSSISDMIRKMKKFVVPPQFNFVDNEDIDPFVMYIFDFEHMLSKQELSDIWQNTMPFSSLKMQKTVSSIAHGTNSEFDFFDIRGDDRISGDMRWMVFKIKQKAENNYYQLTPSEEDDAKFNFSGLENAGFQKNNKTQYSYNWPYDYFSLIELAKIDTEIIISKK